MELKDYITKGIEIEGSLTELATALGIARTSLADARAGRRGLKTEAIDKLSKIIDVDPWDIVRASEYAGAKKKETKDYWLPFVISKEWRRGWDSNPR